MVSRREVLGLLGIAGVAAAVHQARGAGGSSAAVLRRSRDLSGETVDVTDYCVANGRQIDTAHFQELIDLKPAMITYPPTARLVLDGPIHLRGDQSHAFASGSRIDAETSGYALSGIGKTGQHLANLTEPIARYANRVMLDRRADVEVGNVILIADVGDGDLKVDINIVTQVDDRSLTMRYPIGRPFRDPRGVRIYHVHDPLRNLKISGQMALENHHRGGGGLRLTNTADAEIAGLLIENAGYVGLSYESSVGGRFSDITVRGAGASGFGLRAAKAIVLHGFTAKGVRADESLTFYDNVSNVEARNIVVEQYLYEDKPVGFSSGNDILIDLLCSNIALNNVKCIGSATYNLMINNQCDDCSITNFNLRDSNLGGIRVSRQSHNTRIASGTVSGVRNQYDGEGRKPASAISVGASCRGTQIGEDVTYEHIATGRHVDAFRDVS